MTLGEYIELLRRFPSDQDVETGLGNPHSWRGFYAELAFEPVANTTVGKMLEEAESMVGATLHGYKGGEFPCNESTTINIERYGEWTEGTTGLMLLFQLMLGQPQ